MAHLKHPLLGDQTYGGRPRLPKGASNAFIDTLRGFQRQALHAAQLSLFHPESEEWMTWKAPLPRDMQDLLEAVRQDTKENPEDMI
jgi:23S rRNA pseudouridine1911/1915/1917 synthase